MNGRILFCIVFVVCYFCSTKNDKTMYPLITQNTTFEAVILCDGDFPKNAIPLSVLKKAHYVCCCDGATAQCVVHDIMPQAIVGDGDSLSNELKLKFADKLHIVCEQDDNDQTKATRFCRAQGKKRIAYLGSTGRREDHTLGNIALLARYYIDFGLEVTMITDYGYFVATKGKQVFQSFKGQQISLYNIGASKRLVGKGFKWAPYAYKELWQGTLNEALGDEVEIDADGVYLVYRTFEPKYKD